MKDKEARNLTLLLALVLAVVVFVGTLSVLLNQSLPRNMFFLMVAVVFSVVAFSFVLSFSKVLQGRFKDLNPVSFFLMTMISIYFLLQLSPEKISVCDFRPVRHSENVRTYNGDRRDEDCWTWDYTWLSFLMTVLLFSSIHVISEALEEEDKKEGTPAKGPQ